MDWVAFLTDNNIEYVTHGRNVSRGNINIACVWCGDDPSHHLGINLSKDAYGCRRSLDHRGKRPNRLVQALLGCSGTQAALIVKQYSTSDPETLQAALEALTGVAQPRPAASNGPLSLPADFRAITRHGVAGRFWQYLRNRGFEEVDKLVKLYDLRFCTTDRWKDRIILPLYLHNKLVSWTGRALQTPVNAPRYQTLSVREGALFTTKEMLFNEDELDYGDLLFVTEGPFDALKIDFYARDLEVRATCVFGTVMENEQAAIIGHLAKRFKRTVLLFDLNATPAIFSAAERLGAYGVEIGDLAEGIKDPGEMTEHEVLQLTERYLS